jgi:peptidoglycan/LPS O-acetylase OafA/YrhL
MTTQAGRPRARRPELDSLRGVAIVLVVASHAFWRDFVMGGPVGVAVFFALSGYLITGILLDERARTGEIHLAAFFARRARRLLPAVAVFLLAMVLLGALLGPAFATWRDALPTLFYVQNFAHMTPMLTHTLGHTWSLSVEEQFYLVFPLLLVTLGRKASAHRLAIVLAVTAAALMTLRLALWGSGATLERVYYGTDTNAGLLIAGAALAAWVHAHGGLRRDLRPIIPVVVAALVVLGFVADRPGARAAVPVIAALLAVSALLATEGFRVPDIWSPRWLVLVGQRSYGLYLWHYPLFHVLQPRMPEAWWTNVVLALGAWGLTLMSWRYVEAPLLRSRPRNRRQARGVGLATQPVG